MRAKRNLPALDRRPDRASAAGFTVAELLVVLVVFAMLLALAIPRIDTGVRRARLQQAKGELTTAHFLARTSAMRYGRPATLRIDAPNARFWVEVDTSLAGGRKDTIGVVHRMTEGGVTMTTNRSALCFDRRGLGYTGVGCDAPDALITFTLAGRSDTVRTSTIGKIIR
jgi:prepilin-type N-terminal cleavage/methylation domain-containing protein